MYINFTISAQRVIFIDIRLRIVLFVDDVDQVRCLFHVFILLHHLHHLFAHLHASRALCRDLSSLSFMICSFSFFGPCHFKLKSALLNNFSSPRGDGHFPSSHFKITATNVFSEFRLPFHVKFFTL